MRCLSCNASLTDYEATRKSASLNDFIDFCNNCYYTISSDVASLDRTDLAHDEDAVVLDHDSIDDIEIELDNDEQ